MTKEELLPHLEKCKDLFYLDFYSRIRTKDYMCRCPLEQVYCQVTNDNKQRIDYVTAGVYLGVSPEECRIITKAADNLCSTPEMTEYRKKLMETLALKERWAN